METKKKILILCGGKFAFKAIQFLAFEKFLCGIAIGKGSTMLVDSLESEATDSNIPFKSFPDKKSMSEMESWIVSIQPDYIFSISFPFLLPSSVLSYGKDKFINFHPGPLPRYRGVMPIFEVIKNQEKETAICAHFMNEQFDAGNIIFNDIVPIAPEDNYGTLTIQLSNRVGQAALNMANMLEYASRIPSFAQDEKEANYYEKPEFADTYINWKKMDVYEILALVKACNPWNMGADTILLGEQIKIITASLVEEKHNNETLGSILSITSEGWIKIACTENAILAIQILKTDEGIMSSKQYWDLKKLDALPNQNY